jgi:hypothetical protein
VTTFKLGDRVRVTSTRPIHGYATGCKGVVKSEAKTESNGETYYAVRIDRDTVRMDLDTVRMDGDDAGNMMIFLAEELEPDA